MREQAKRARTGGPDTGWLLLAGLLVVFVAVAMVYWLSAVVGGAAERADSKNPAAIIAAQATGRAPWTGLQTFVLIAGLIVLAAVAALLVWAGTKASHGQSRVDRRAHAMAHSRDFKKMMGAGAAADADRLGAAEAGPGVPLGRLVNNNKMLYGSWEWVQIWICGPRAGKSTCVVVPQIMESNGPVLTTTNKRDVVDMTRGPRSRLGRVWVHDVQNIIGEPATWWWNPLSFVTDMVKAERLVAVFQASRRGSDAREDAYFASAARELLANYFYAAAVGGRPITDVHRWANDETDFTAVGLLREAGEFQYAASLEKTQNLTERQRDGIYGQVRNWVSILGNPTVVPWVRADANPDRREFDTRAFVESKDTMYLVSREGAGSASAITAALVMAILVTAEEKAARRPEGRLATPLAAVLDEAANVVPWPELPDVYSHYGSRGIIIASFFQSYEQGADQYGEKGMNKMWSAANVRAAGSGLAEDKFLPFLASLVGDQRVRTFSSSYQSGHFGQQNQQGSEKERIFDVSDIAQLPVGRAILTVAGQPAALLALEHYTEKPYGQDIMASKSYYGSQAAEAGMAVDYD